MLRGDFLHKGCVCATFLGSRAVWLVIRLVFYTKVVCALLFLRRAPFVLVIRGGLLHKGYVRATFLGRACRLVGH